MGIFSQMWAVGSRLFRERAEVARPKRRRWIAAAVMGAAILHSGGAAAEEKPKEAPLQWDPAWSHAGPWDYALTGIGLTTLITETALLQDRAPDPRWFEPILFDSAVRNATRGTTTQIRDDAATVSWGLWFVEMGYPFAVDVPYAWARYGRGVAWDLFWQSATTLSLSGAFDFALRDIVGRVRPSNYECLTSGGSGCLNGPETRRSFPSGHFTETSTATALICTQHLKLHLYGGAWDGVTCATAIAADAAVGTLRLVADDHWATDVIAGGAIGFLFGWGVPTVMHLHGHAEANMASRSGPFTMVLPLPMLFPAGAGLGATGVF
jgi:membrane-associated phospholipid phosphatase